MKHPIWNTLLKKDARETYPREEIDLLVKEAPNELREHWLANLHAVATLGNKASKAAKNEIHYSCLLLGALAEPRAFDDLLSLFKLSDSVADSILGDFFLENVPWALHHCSQGREDFLWKILSDLKARQVLVTAAQESLLCKIKSGLLKQEPSLNRMRELIEFRANAKEYHSVTELLWNWATSGLPFNQSWAKEFFDRKQTDSLVGNWQDLVELVLEPNHRLHSKNTPNKLLSHSIHDQTYAWSIRAHEVTPSGLDPQGSSVYQEDETAFKKLSQDLLKKLHGFTEHDQIPQAISSFEELIRQTSQKSSEGLLYRNLLHFGLGLKLSPQPDITGVMERARLNTQGIALDRAELERRRNTVQAWWSCLDLHFDSAVANLIDPRDLENASGPGATWHLSRVNDSLSMFLDGLERGSFFSRPVANQRIASLIDMLLKHSHALIKAEEEAIQIGRSRRSKHWDSPPSAKIIESHEKILLLLQSFLAFWRDHWRGILGALRENQRELLRMRQHQQNFPRTASHFLSDDFLPDNVIPFRREEPKVGRNASCPCGSGKKYKHCCGG